MIWEKEIQDFVADKLTGFSLNVPCGSSTLGSVRLDLDPKALGITKTADMNALPFENGTFDSDVQDPPWKLNFYQRARPFFELIRVVKVGGTIVYNPLRSFFRAKIPLPLSIPLAQACKQELEIVP